MLDLENGTNLLIGQPSSKPSRGQIKRISAALADLDQVREAHLPGVMRIGSGEPSETVLYVVVDEASEIAATAERIQAHLTGGLWKRSAPTLWVVDAQHELLETVRAVECVVGWRD